MPIHSNERPINTTTKICMISGKGGCGKTTTALVLSKLLVACGKKVLLIDCDLTTQGASCFLHNLIIDNNYKYTEISCIDCIVGKTASDENDYKLTGTDREKLSKITHLSGVDFIPYNIDQTENTPIVPNASVLKNLVEKYINGNFDVIIFDCQAGYNNLSVDLIEMCDKVIFMSGDDISSETATELLRGRLLNVSMQKQKFVIRNKWFNSREKKYAYNNQLMQYTTPIMFCKEVGRNFSLSNFEKLDFNNNMCLPLRYLLDVTTVAAECFSEYKDSILQTRRTIQRKWLYRKIGILLIICAGLIGLITIFNLPL